MTEETLSQRISHAYNDVRVSDLRGFCDYSKHHITYCHFSSIANLKAANKVFQNSQTFSFFFILSPFKFLNRPIFTCLTNSFGKSVGYFLLEGSHGYKDSFLSIVIKLYIYIYIYCSYNHIV